MIFLMNEANNKLKISYKPKLIPFPDATVTCVTSIHIAYILIAILQNI